MLGTKAGVERAFKKLDQIKGDIQWWEAGAQPPQLLASGDVVMSSVYNGRIRSPEGRQEPQAGLERQHLRRRFLGHSQGHAKRDEAYKFIKFASQPENQRVFAGEIPYGPTHMKGIAGMDPKIAAELPTAPENLKGALASNTEFWVENGEDLEQRFNAWAAR